MIDLAEQMTQVMLNQQRLDLVTDFWPQDMSWRGPLGRRVGADTFVDEVMRPFFRAFPDYVATNDVWVADEQRQLVASWGHFTATHRDTFCGVAGTGKPVDVRFMDIWSCRDGKLVDNWVQVDHTGFLHQIGAFDFDEVLPGIGPVDEGAWLPVADVDPDFEGAAAAAWSARAPGVVLELLASTFDASAGPAQAASTAAPDPDGGTLWHGPLGFGSRTGGDLRRLHVGAALRTAFADLAADVDFWLLDPSTRRAAVWGHLRGRQTGPYLGVSPQGSGPLELSFMTFCQLAEDDAVQQVFTQIDNTTFLRDTGAVAGLAADPNQLDPV